MIANAKLLMQIKNLRLKFYFTKQVIELKLPVRTEDIFIHFLRLTLNYNINKAAFSDIV